MPYFAGVPQLKHWHNTPGPVGAGGVIVHNSLYIAPLDVEGEPFPGNILANTFGMAVSYSMASSQTSLFSSTYRLGIYTRDVSTLRLVNSASSTFGYSGATSTAATWSTNFNGARLLTMASSQWSSAPIFQAGSHYWLGVGFATHGFTSIALSQMGAGTAISTVSMVGALGVGSSSATSANQWAIFRGAYASTTAALPATIEQTALVASAATGSFSPWVRLDADMRNYA